MHLTVPTGLEVQLPLPMHHRPGSKPKDTFFIKILLYLTSPRSAPHPVSLTRATESIELISINPVTNTKFQLPEINLFTPAAQVNILILIFEFAHSRYFLCFVILNNCLTLVQLLSYHHNTSLVLFKQPQDNSRPSLPRLLFPGLIGES